MGRNTHEAADKPHRRRIIFSRTGAAPDWRRETQVWVDPSGLSPADLPALVGEKYALRKGLILGGTMVHDWFHSHNAIHRIKLTVEPTVFGDGLPMFSDQRSSDPVEICVQSGYKIVSEAVLNDSGTRFLVLEP